MENSKITLAGGRNLCVLPGCAPEQKTQSSTDARMEYNIITLII